MSAAEAPKNNAPAAAEALPPAVLDKYKAAAQVVASAVKTLAPQLVDGASVLELCKAGDAALEAEAGKVYNLKGAKAVQKGIAYPTAISVNSTLCHFSPLPSGEEASVKIAKGDLVKVVLGAHIDGYASLSGETFVVGADANSPVTGQKADLLAAAYNAVEAGLRGAKVGSKNWEITDNITKALAEYSGAGIKGVEGMLSNQHQRNDIQASKTICPFPSLEQRRDSNISHVLEDGTVYHLDVSVTNAANPTAKPSPYFTTIYCKAPEVKYSLKMKASRTTFSEISNKAGSFPFSLRSLENETQARLGVTECAQHGLLKAYEPLTTEKSSDLAAQVLVTFAVGKNGVTKFSHAPAFYQPDSSVVKPDTEIKSEELKTLLAEPLKANKKKAKKEAAAAK